MSHDRGMIDYLYLHYKDFPVHLSKTYMLERQVCSPDHFLINMLGGHYLETSTTLNEIFGVGNTLKLTNNGNS